MNIWIFSYISSNPKWHKLFATWLTMLFGVNLSVSLASKGINPLKCHTLIMTSSNGNIFCVTGPLCGEFTGDRRIPHTKASDAELCYFLWSAPEQTVKKTIETHVIWYATALIMTSPSMLYFSIFAITDNGDKLTTCTYIIHTILIQNNAVTSPLEY